MDDVCANVVEYVTDAERTRVADRYPEGTWHSRTEDRGNSSAAKDCSQEFCRNRAKHGESEQRVIKRVMAGWRPFEDEK